MAQAQRTLCDLCDAPLDPGGHYVVRIDVFADPSLPEMNSDELEATDFDQTFQALLAQMEGMTAEDLQDDVHRRFEYRLCRRCQRVVLANPLGKPRTRRVGEN